VPDVCGHEIEYTEGRNIHITIADGIGRPGGQDGDKAQDKKAERKHKNASPPATAKNQVKISQKKQRYETRPGGKKKTMRIRIET
jgi:hypothetical protein